MIYALAFFLLAELFIFCGRTQPAFSSSMLTKETPKHGVKYVQS